MFGNEWTDERTNGRTGIKHCAFVGGKESGVRNTKRNLMPFLYHMRGTGSGHVPLDIFPPGHVPPDISPPGQFPLPLHGVGHSPHHHHAPIYIKRSTVNVYKIDSG